MRKPLVSETGAGIGALGLSGQDRLARSGQGSRLVPAASPGGPGSSGETREKTHARGTGDTGQLREARSQLAQQGGPSPRRL